MEPVSAETIRMIKEAQAKALESPQLKRAFTVASNITNYNLEPAAKLLYPVITPLRNKIPRISAAGKGDTATRWKAVTGINTSGVNAGIAEGKRGGVIAQTTKTYTAPYATIGLEDSVTFEADEAAEGFDDARALMAQQLLRSNMIEEEFNIVGGNYSLALGTTNTPVLSTGNGSGGGINDSTTVYVLCVGLTLDGYRYTTVAGGCLGQVTRTNADGSTDSFGGYNSKISASANITTGTPGTNDNYVRAYVTPKAGTVAYAWYWGASAAGATIGAITTINSVQINVAAGTGTQAANDAKVTTDYSQNNLIFDGLIYQVAGAAFEDGGSAPAGYVAVQATGTPGTGTPLTADGAGGITEIDTDFKAFWDNFRVSPTMILVHAQELGNITKKVVSGGSTPLFRFNLDAATGTIPAATLSAGTVIGTYFNKYTMGGGQLVKVMLHPNVPPGTIIYYSDELPYPLSGITNILQMKTRKEYYQTEWPLKTRKYESGVYVTEVLQNYFPPAFGVRYNIANG